jgi:aerobic carbon-monoxide dehydrogenase large subunit
VHESWPDNVAYVSRAAVGDVDAAMAKAEVLVAERFRHPRLAAMPIETRGVLAYVDDSNALVAVSSTQHPYHVREAIADVLGLVEERLRVIAPDVGGSFGAKGQVYPEGSSCPLWLCAWVGRSSGSRAATSTSWRPAMTVNKCMKSGSGSNGTAG